MFNRKMDYFDSLIILQLFQSGIVLNLFIFNRLKKGKRMFSES